MLREETLLLLIRKCRLSQEEAQELMYDSFFDFAKTICADYSKDVVEQLEIINLGFRKSFKYIHHFNTNSRNLSEDFQEWIRKMMIYAAVEYSRNNFKLSYFLNFDSLKMGNSIKNGKNNIKTAISKLSLSGKIVLNLTIVQGFNEQELAQCLEIPLEKAQSLLFEVTTRFNELLVADTEITYSDYDHNNRKDLAKIV